jgi:acyl-coenzyme A thioesterase PaaI-like protein
MPPSSNRVLSLWAKLSGLPLVGSSLGKWLFAQALCRTAPYFSSIAPRVEEIGPGRCVASMRKRRSVTNHIGTVHAIAMCNLAELVAGTMCEATVPQTHRWIPKGMTVEYLKKAATDLTAVAAWEPLPAFDATAADIPVPVRVTDTSGTEVFRAVITMHISPRKS